MLKFINIKFGQLNPQNFIRAKKQNSAPADF